MKQKLIGSTLYIFQVEPYQITEDTNAQIIKVQEESYPGFVELNPTLEDKLVKYNYKVICINQQEWMPYIDQPDLLSPELAWSANSATVTIGADDNVFPTLTNPHGVTVTYSSSDTTKATINASTGAITLASAGDTTISAAFAGNDTYYEQTVSYTLTVQEAQKRSPELAWSSDSAAAVVGETNTYPTLTNTDNVDVTYDSSDTSVATIASDGTVTLLEVGTTTISAIFAGDTTYVAKTVSYSLTVSQHDYSTDYLTTKALGSGNISFSGSGASYRKNNGEWTNYTEAISVVQDDVVEWKGTLTPTSYGIGKIGSTGNIDVYGNVMSMLFGDNFANQTDLTGKKYVFNDLFEDNDHLINAKNLILPATTLAESCYIGMFNGCTSLITAPELPATTLARGCYISMFWGCTSLTTAPTISATTLADSCYNSMFRDCTGLTTAQTISATTLADSCCTSMFEGCTSLTTAPTISATTLADSCYDSMFWGCTSLTTAPELPATTLAQHCYFSMFWGCTSLTTAPELPATTLVKGCYRNMFNGCTSLNNVTCLATDISAEQCVDSWLNNTSASGTFIKDPNMTGWVVGTNVPSGWTIEDYSE